MAGSKQNEELYEQLNIVEKLKAAQKDLALGTNDTYNILKTINSLEQKMFDRAKKDLTENQLKKLNIQKAIHKLGKYIEDQSKTGITDADRFRKAVENIGKLRIKELDLTEKISDQDRLRNAKLELYNTLGLGKTVELFKKLNEQWKENPMLAILTIANKLLSDFLVIFKEVDGAAADFRINMGFVRSDTQILEKNVRAAYFNLAHTGVEAKNLYESFQAISKTIGTSQATTIDMAKDMSLMSVSLGVVQETSAEFSRTMGMVARNTMDSQKNITLFVSKLSAAAGTNLNEVMTDVMTATKASYQFLIKSPIALAKAAVEAKKMGTSIAEVAASAKILVNFTESVKDEMAASVLLGESINLQRARELSYRKDLAGLNKEILELAKKSRFEDLDPFQQEAVAKALGKSADELGKMLQADREMARIRSDGSLAKQVREYDKLKNANDALVKSTAESAREQLQLRSNLEATKSISLALRSIYRSMFQPLVDLAAEWLPKIASWISAINLHLGKWAGVGLGLVTIIGLIVGAKGLGKLASWATGGLGKSVGGMFRGISLGVSSFGSPNVIRGAVGMLLVATSLIPLAYALKLMEGVEWKTFGIMAASLGVLTLAVLALGGIMMIPGLNVALLAGAAALFILSVSLIPAAYAFKLFGEAVKILSDIDLLSVAGGLAAMVPPLFKLAMIVPFLGMMAAGMTLFGLSLRVIVGPVERMGVAASQLGMGLDKAVNALSRLAELKIGDTLAQFKDLSSTISNISKTVSEIPDIKIEKLQDIIVKAGEMGTAQAQKNNDEILLALQDIKMSVEMLRSSLEKGGIPANVHLDSQRMDSAMARALAFKGTLSPQPHYT
jgi:hypothetical protein